MTIEYRYDHAIVTSDDYPNMRFIVHPDTDASDPIIESGAPVELYAFAGGYCSTLSDNVTGYWDDVFSRFYSQWDEDKALATTRRFARIFHGWSSERAEESLITYHYRGHSQSDWQHLFVAVTEEGYGNAEGWAEEWAQWARGDVFGVCPERYIPCEHPETCHGDEEDHWVRVNDQGVDFDNLWGIYADDAEEAVKHFVENYL